MTADAIQDRTTWAPEDLTDAVAGRPIPPGEVLARTDGVCLLYAGRCHTVQGESEALKSWTAIMATAQIINEPNGDVVWIDYEDNAQGVVGRLLATGVPPGAILERLSYIRPAEALGDRQGRIGPGVADLAAAFRGRDVRLVIIDGVTESMAVEGLNLIDNADIALWQRRLPRSIARDTGAAVLTIDHVPKNRENHGRFALGGQHKLAGIDGAAYRVDLVRPLSRATGTEPVTGETTITVVKDRVGHVRGHADASGRVASLQVTAWPDGGIALHLEPPGAIRPPHQLVKAIADHLAIYTGATKTNIEEALDGKATTIRAALAWMADPSRGWVRVEKVGVAHRHYLTEVGAQQVLEGT